MTTIAYDPFNGIIASDSQESDCGRKTPTKKLYKVNNHIIATAGGTYAGLLFVEWFDEWESEPDWSDRPDLINLDWEEDFECMVIRPGGTCYTVNRLFAPYERDISDFIVLGSGSKVALGSLKTQRYLMDDINIDVKLAVRIACDVDEHSSGKIQTMKVT